MISKQKMRKKASDLYHATLCTSELNSALTIVTYHALLVYIITCLHLFRMLDCFKIDKVNEFFWYYICVNFLLR